MLGFASRNNSAGILRFASRNDSGDMLRFASAVAGFGRVTRRQAVSA